MQRNFLYGFACKAALKAAGAKATPLFTRMKEKKNGL